MREAVRYLTQSDPRLGRLMARVGPCRLQARDYGSTFEALARSIAFQQLSTRAATTIYGRFLHRYGDGQSPDPARVARAQIRGLRGVGLSQGKARYIRGLAQAHVAGELPDRKTLDVMDDAEVIDNLVRHLGVGIWTVQMLLIFWLGRPDVLAVNDLWLQKGLMRAHGLASMPAPQDLQAAGETWRPWRSVASWYLWRITELPDD